MYVCDVCGKEGDSEGAGIRSRTLAIDGRRTRRLEVDEKCWTRTPVERLYEAGRKDLRPTRGR